MKMLPTLQILSLFGLLFSSLVHSGVPVISGAAPADAQVGQLYSYQVEAVDPDGGALSYELVVSVGDMSISPSGLITWIPGNVEAGDQTFDVRVSDSSGASAFSYVGVAVFDPSNQVPAISNAPTEESSTVSNLYSIQIQATDGDNDALTYDVTSWPAVAGLVVSDQGVVSWQSTNRDDAGEYWIIVKVDDGRLGRVDAQFKLTVVDPSNQIPVIAEEPIAEGAVNATYVYSVQASDQDGDSLSYSVSSWPVMPGLSINNEGVISWTSSSREDTGEYWVSIAVDDGHLGIASKKYTLVISDPNNSIPIINQAPILTAFVGQEYRYDLAASDADGDALSYEVSMWPAGMGAQISTDGVVTWTPLRSHTGKKGVTIRVYDGHLGKETLKFDLNVVDLENQSPVINSTPGTLATAGVAYQYEVTASDPDGDNVSISLNYGPSGMIFDEPSNTIRWTPPEASDKAEQIKIEAKDGFGGLVRQVFWLNVIAGVESDIDGDGYPDDVDDFPTNPAEWLDTDGDGDGNNADLDDDNDDVLDVDDAFPLDSTESSDLDNDGEGDNRDPDRDGDFVLNDSDAYPNDPTRSVLPIVSINSPTTLSTVGETPITVTGIVAADASVLTVNGVPVVFDSGQFSTDVSLQEGHNAVIARMVTVSGEVSTSSVSISLDTTPPYLTVESHIDGQTVFDSTVSISGLINDIVRGTIEETEAVVTVNGVVAAIRNRGYLAEGVVLVPGVNTITVSASDQAGNTKETIMTLDYQAPIGKRLEIAGGQGQSADVASSLSDPLAIRVLDDSGQPVSMVKVIFRVTQGAGILSAGNDYEGRAVIVDTDADGVARAQFKLGYRAGAGNQKVRARVVGYDDEQVFYASVLQKLGDKIGITVGNNQRGGLFQRLPSPLIVSVTDEGSNLVEGAPVLFEVLSGGGYFENGEQALTVYTDTDGRASANFTLGAVVGLDKQRVVATLTERADTVPDNIILRSVFTASGFVTGPAGETIISGVILDNQNNPLPGATIRVEGTTRQTIAESDGKFTITEAPVGPVHLIFDGSTVDAEGEYPTLSSDIVTVSGVNNPLTKPIYLVKLNLDNAVYAGLQDVAISLDAVPGFKLEIPAGSVTFPNGEKEGYVSVTMVNASAVPMAPPNGMQPKFIVTVQPTGAVFDPPARLTMPNVDGFVSGKQVEMFSYDHDLEEFATIGFGTVAEDGKTITSNPGVGIVKAGWTCAAETAANGIPFECGDCSTCSGLTCGPAGHVPTDQQFPDDCLVLYCDGVNDPAPGETSSVGQTDKDCKDVLCDGSVVAADDPEDDPGWCEDPICNGIEPGTRFNRDDMPADDPFDCVTPVSCSSGTVNGEDHFFLHNVVDPDGGFGESLEDFVPGDCRKPGCTLGGWNTAGVTDLSDHPDPGNICQSCSPTGYPVMLSGPIGGEGSECGFCLNGQIDSAAANGRIDACSVCDSGTKVFSPDNLGACQQCDGNGDLVNLDGPIGSGSDCIVCEGGQQVSSDCSSSGSIRLVDKRDNNRVTEGEIILIGPEPSMPELEATISYTDLPPANVDWSLTSEFPRRPAGGARFCSDENLDDKSFTSTLGEDQAWLIHELYQFDASNNYFGAANVSSGSGNQALISATGAGSIGFKIHGENPSRSSVESVINGFSTPHDYMYRIALHESTAKNFASLGTVFQFNRRNASDRYALTPNFGGPDGWGIMQVDRSFGTSGICSASNRTNPNPVTTEWIWNWRSNVAEGIRIANTKRDRVISGIDKLRDYYQGLGDGEWVEPPVDFSVDEDLPRINTVDACAIQGYNGFSRSIAIAGRGYAQFCMEFDQETSTWTFLANTNRYIEEIMRTSP